MVFCVFSGFLCLWWFVVFVVVYSVWFVVFVCGGLLCLFLVVCCIYGGL